MVQLPSYNTYIIIVFPVKSSKSQPGWPLLGTLKTGAKVGILF